MYTFYTTDCYPEEMLISHFR